MEVDEEIGASLDTFSNGSRRFSKGELEAVFHKNPFLEVMPTPDDKAEEIFVVAYCPERGRTARWVDQKLANILTYPLRKALWLGRLVSRLGLHLTPKYIGCPNLAECMLSILRR